MLPPTDPLTPAIARAIAQLPFGMQPLLKSWLAQHSLARITPLMMQQLMSVSGLDCRGVTLALLPLAAAYSYAAISHFHVGAIAWGASGHFYLGANMEFARQSLSQTIHAEQCALNHAWLSGETGILAITINASPCGHCRQFMNETISASGLTIHLPGGEHALQQLLPAAFGPTDLGITEPLFSTQRHPLAEIQDTPLLHAAWLAASQSYAPYSRTHAGVALQTHSGEVFSGRYAENAAFNPSLPPLQSALIMLRMAGFVPDDVVAVSLVESQDGQISHQASTLALLDAYGIHQFEYRSV